MKSRIDTSEQKLEEKLREILDRDIKKVLAVLTAEKLKSIIKKAETRYIYGNPFSSDNHAIMKNIITFGLSGLYRNAKVKDRLSELNSINDDNVKQKLYEFLSTKGHDDAASFKHEVIYILLGEKEYKEALWEDSMGSATDGEYIYKSAEEKIAAFKMILENDYNCKVKSDIRKLDLSERPQDFRTQLI